MLAIGSDHGGFLLKEEVKNYFIQNKIPFQDFGIFTNIKSDYPPIAQEVATEIAIDNFDKGLLFCGTGLGMAITANKIKGIRAISAIDPYSVKYSRLHNNANILCLGGRVVSSGLAIELINIFLNTNFEGGRHQRRLDMIESHKVR